jgi:TPR repeat protein
MNVRQAILASFTSTALLAIGLVSMRDWLFSAPDEDAHLIRVQSIVAEISSKEFGGSPEQMARAIAARESPATLLRLFADLWKRKNPMAALIAEAGAERYHHPSLLAYAGREYQLGRFVERDYVKAERFLTDPVLLTKPTPAARFFLGEVLIAADNPRRDEARGMALIRKAAETYEPARKRLAQLEAGDE